MTHLRATPPAIDGEAVGIELQRVLVTLIDLSLIGTHASWNVVGPSFRSLHLELGELIAAWRGAADAVGERIVALGRFPDGRAETVAAQSDLPTLSDGPQGDQALVGSLTVILTGALRFIRPCQDRIEGLDPVTADLLHSVVATLEDQLAMIRAEADLRDVTAEILAAKLRRGLSFTQIAEHVGADPVWLTAALHGQHPLSGEQAAAVTTLLELPAEAAAVLGEIPTRGSFDTLPPADPTIDRLYEALQLYGPALKVLIHEDLGAGNTSAITFNLALERREDTVRRVRITLDGAPE